MDNNHNFCKICLRKMQSNSIFIECINCHHKYHAKCINADRNDLVTNALWYCMCCIQTIFPFNHIEDNQEFYSVIMECVSDFPYQFHEMNDKVFIHLKSIRVLNPFTEMDPDIQFYSSTHYALNTRCEYYIEDTFVTNIAEKKSV